MLARLGSARCWATSGSSAVRRTPVIVAVTSPCCTNRRRTLAAVKELPWCAPSDSPNKKKQAALLQQQAKNAQQLDQAPLIPVGRFGIVGAMSRNRVIGMHGKLPWNCPKDRHMFEALTRDKILIVGRKTFQEMPNLSHVSHPAHCIVVSKTLIVAPSVVEQLLGDEDVPATTRACQARNGLVPNIHVAPCLDAALDLARQLLLAKESGPRASTNLSDGEDDSATNSNSDDTTIDCWVGGGERIFDEALLHPSAHRLHLTIFDMVVPLEAGLDMSNVARFPPKYRWDHQYRQVSATNVPASSESLNFTHCIYERIQGYSRAR